MKIVSLAIAAGIALAPVAAFAQQGGGQRPCAADIQKYCAGTGQEGMQACIKENFEKFSDACKAAIQARRQQQGGGQ